MSSPRRTWPSTRQQPLDSTLSCAHGSKPAQHQRLTPALNASGPGTPRPSGRILAGDEGTYRTRNFAVKKITPRMVSMTPLRRLERSGAPSVPTRRLRDKSRGAVRSGSDVNPCTAICARVLRLQSALTWRSASACRRPAHRPEDSGVCRVRRITYVGLTRNSTIRPMADAVFVRTVRCEAAAGAAVRGPAT